LKPDVGGEDCKALISVAGNDHIAAHDGTSRDTATALRQLNAAQVHVARETLICSVSLQPHTDHASSLPDAMPPT